MGEDITAKRKDAHLDLCATGDVEPTQNSTLLECVRLVHCAMPEMAVEDVDLSMPFLGKRLRYRVRVRSFDAICRMVASGAGLAVLPESAVVRSRAPKSPPVKRPRRRTRPSSTPS